MPKLKTHSGAAKRFKKRGKGFKHKCSNLKHILTKKAQKRKRNLRNLVDVSKADVKSVARMVQGS